MTSLKRNRIHPSQKEKKAIFLTLLIALIVVVAISSVGFFDNHIQVESDHLNISGPLGTSIALGEIDSMYLTEKRPEAIRIRGYQMGYRKKGRFRNSQGEKFQMFINSRALPWIVIQKKDGQKIYYSHSRKSNRDILYQLIEALSNQGHSRFR